MFLRQNCQRWLLAPVQNQHILNSERYGFTTICDSGFILEVPQGFFFIMTSYDWSNLIEQFLIYNNAHKNYK